MASQIPAQTTATIPNERRERATREVKKLIEDRNNVLTQYYNLVKQIEELDAANGTHELLQEFCQELVDYLATGHFELYRRIEEGNERRDDIKKLANEIMPKITITTEVAMAFNDLFDGDNDDNVNDKVLEKLPSQLTQLGEHLALRIDLEDQLIDTLLSTIQQPKANRLHS